MPIAFVCKNCGYVFHYLEKVGQDYIGVPSVLEILGRYGYTCPKCKSRLTPPSEADILITSTLTARRRGLLPIRIGTDYYVRPSTTILNLTPKPTAEETS